MRNEQVPLKLASQLIWLLAPVADINRTTVREGMGGGGNLRDLFCYVVAGELLFAAVAQAQQTPSLHQSSSSPTLSTSQAANSSLGQSNSGAAGSIFGTVVDQGGAVAVGAQVQLTRPGELHAQPVLSGDNGQFAFNDLASGPFQLTITAPGFETRTLTGQLQSGQALLVPVIVLSVAPATTTINVGLKTEEVAQIEIKQQEKQRVLDV